jgi:uncharacterized protein DUF998
MIRKALLACGILSSLLYVAMNVFVAMQYQRYSFLSQTISELSAIDAPTRPLWVPLGIVYTLLVAAFGFGVWKSAGRSWPVHVLGGLLIVSGIIGLGWPPMHQRAVLASGGGTLTDTLHLVWAAVTTLFFILEIGFGAAALGKRFRIYSIVTMAILAMFGALVGVEAPNVGKNLPTPWIGVWERLNIGVFMLWVIVLAIALLRVRQTYDVRAMKSIAAS